MSRQKTVEEVREDFIQSVQSISSYWSKQQCNDKDKCYGVAFSILNLFDGTSLYEPAMDIVLSTHEDDKQYCIDNNEDWYENGMVINDCMLHELFFK